MSMTSQEIGLFAYGDEIIHYQVIRKQTDISSKQSAINKKHSVKARKVTIKVHPDQRVVATAPIDATSDAIQEAVLKRAKWIWKHLSDFNSQHDYVLPRKYISGETQFYLGRRYVLKVLNDYTTKSNTKLLRGQLTVNLYHSGENQPKKVKALIDKWYLSKAKNIFNERLNAVAPRATWVKEIPSFRIMAMKKQWGSCSKKGTLILNAHLVKAPKECIDYVILHELCHLSEHNHSEKFWKLLNRVMPNWKEIKYKLDEMAELYLNE
ncbi:MAG: M48 family metallopeptidase [gamma proteobacterium symbiont of Bathyaustriella thionipta]|nr:M48 family metallopeptidase [gamma proteobacterium symbiont of Bathyaustriella thionipta]MCU7950380.1 M48 family metallopeptidase [gamma proteobacterium symbiont of Bathyaustriella thionipta]MCU7952369.1 M48 family metallopeptidase [gamma proteobacterium symbiont of Bathyaustriella thionipta]MCU7956882.1 M48 family metallopeptidase [gamma proteobacterium symbiont of Bathyaustriella thionipta]MCU7966489.1 M48 family metallopeptidase [gamma proteobacterium symbiont of Bathyaustriella thionipta